MGKSCQICGAPSGIFPLCKKHNDDKEKGLVVKDETTGKWIEATTINNSKKDGVVETKSKIHKCPICDDETKNKLLCDNCYKRVDSQTEIINKNTTLIKLRDYYYNLKNFIFRTEYDDIEILNNQFAKLFALADLTKRLFNKEDLINKIFNDINDIKEWKLKKSEKTKTEEEQIDINLNTAGVNRTKDGHFVKSEYEVTIDDILYELSEIHVYEKIVTPITERTVVCDWYLPVYKNKGIYIELWGIDKNYKYNINKEEKRMLYKKHNLKLIEIEKDEVKGDTLGLSERIEQKIIKYRDEIKQEI